MAGGFAAQGLYAAYYEWGTVNDKTKLGKELEMEFPEATKRIDEYVNSLAERRRNPENFAHITVEYCEAFNKHRQGMCNAALDSMGNCPYEREHGDHLEQ